jgi:signal transduction histidine kinase
MTTGIDLIHESVKAIEKESSRSCVSSHHKEDSAAHQKHINQIKLCVKNYRNISTFMIMAINRCIDYVKVNKGLKLTPRNETIDLMDALSMPMDCMKNIQEKIEIALQPVPKEICSHIITDKQWLQENLLCLLSNAVKYSASGEVSITISKVDRLEETACCNRSEVGSDCTETIIDGGNSDTVPFDVSWSRKRHYSRILPVATASESRDDSIRSRQSGGKMQTYIRVEVEDHGIGVSPSVATTLFNPFKQAQRLAGGTGESVTINLCMDLIYSSYSSCYYRIGIVLIGKSSGID